MPKITYIEHSGRAHTVEAVSGLSLMENAVRNSVPGIDADCGGACACATCHVYVEAQWAEGLSGPDVMETSMLEFADNVADNSRLSCQIPVTDAMDGFTVRMPRSQH